MLKLVHGAKFTFGCLPFLNYVSCAKYKKYELATNQTLQPKSHERNKHLGSLPYNILGTIFQMNKGRSRQKNKIVDDDTPGVRFERWHKNKEEEDSPELRIA